MRRIDDCPGCQSPTFDNVGCFDRNTNYVWEALQGITMSAHLLARLGYQSFGWQSAAVERAHRWLYTEAQFPPEQACSGGVGCDACATGGLGNASDDTWVAHIVKAHNHPPYLDPQGVLVFGGDPGKNCGFADWWALGIP